MFGQFDSEPQLSTKVTPSRFMFDTSLSNAHYEETVARFNTLRERISKLINDPTIGGQPVVRFIMGLNPETDDLVVVGKALLRLSELLEPFRRIEQLVAVLAFAREHPDQLAMAFGDMSTEVDTLLKGLGEELDEPSQ